MRRGERREARPPVDHVGFEEHGVSVLEHRGQVWDRLLKRNPAVRRFEVRSPRVDAAHDGVTIAHLTDLHLKTEWSARRLRRAVRLINELEPDAVVLTGDYVRYSAEALPHLAGALAELEPPKFATLGNHDHWLDAAGVTAALEVGGCRVLRNEHVTLELGGAPLHFVGIDDRYTRHDDASRAFAGVAERGTRVVLSHIPEVADEIGSHGGALVLSGHTHGGQVNLPGVTVRFFRRLGRRYLSGFFPIDGQVLYVNHGLGASVPIRIGVPPEVAVFVLRASSR